MKNSQRKQFGPYVPDFTPRELELIRIFVEQGKSSKEIAWELHLSGKTVETHRANIMRKLRDILGISEIDYVSAVDMALFALCNGLVDRTVIEKRYCRSAIPSPS